MEDKPCDPGEHVLKPVKIDELIEKVKDMVHDEERWQRTVKHACLLTQDENLRSFLGIDFATSKDICYLILIGLDRVGHVVLEEVGEDFGSEEINE